MMTKKIISIIVAIAAIGAAAVTSAVIKRNSNTILNQNVEALMDGEQGTGICYNSISTVEGGQYVLYCGSCTWTPGKPALFSSKGTC